jgi:hypothetical protein
MLAEVGLVRDVRRGRERSWKLAPSPLDPGRRCLDLVSQRWDGVRAHLAVMVEVDDD